MRVICCLLLALCGKLLDAAASDTFSIKSKDFIVNQHNQKRRDMLPLAAADMVEVSWDEELALKAMELSSSCVFAHKVDGYGQNLFMSSNGRDDTNTITVAMNAWVDSELPPSLVTKLRAQGDALGEGVYNHASQILWSSTTRVGCGYTSCSNGFFVVCNYYPAGNWQGKPWYKVGSACSACPTNAPYCNAGLCTSSEPQTATSATSPPQTAAPTTSPPHTTAATTTTLAPTTQPATTLSPQPSVENSKSEGPQSTKMVSTNDEPGEAILFIPRTIFNRTNSTNRSVVTPSPSGSRGVTQYPAPTEGHASHISLSLIILGMYLGILLR